jgi:thiamine-monophosphate kinase
VTSGCTTAQALGDGEDYEILFTVEPGRAAGLPAAWTAEFPELPLTRIGSLVEISAGESLTGGWEHFSVT